MIVLYQPKIRVVPEHHTEIVHANEVCSLYKRKGYDVEYKETYTTERITGIRLSKGTLLDSRLSSSFADNHYQIKEFVVGLDRQTEEAFFGYKDAFQSKIEEVKSLQNHNDKLRHELQTLKLELIGYTEMGWWGRFKFLFKGE